jgi:hypothetical protein
MRINANSSRISYVPRSYTDDPWIASDPGPAVVSKTPSQISIQFTISEVEEALFDLDADGPDRIPPSILKKCTYLLNWRYNQFAVRACRRRSLHCSLS